jgi:tetratricopeptide (TPR) repeat protein
MAGAYVQRGMMYKLQGAYDSAIADLNEAITLNPIAQNYYHRGTVLEAMGDVNRAIEDFSKVISKDPRFSYAYLQRGTNYLKGGNRVEAIRDLEQYLKLAPDAENAQELQMVIERLKQV